MIQVLNGNHKAACKKYDGQIRDMTSWVEEMGNETLKAEKDKERAIAATERHKNIAASRLQKWRMEVMLRHQVEDSLAKSEKEALDLRCELELINRLQSQSERLQRRMKKEWVDIVVGGK